MTRSRLALPLIALLAACGSTAETLPPAEPTDVDLSLTLVTHGLEFPWGMAFLPNGDLLVTEREGRLRIIRDGVLDPAPVAGIPGDILVLRQGGLMDVALHPDFETNRTVYLTYAQGTDDENATVVASGTLSEDGASLTGTEDIFTANVPGKRSGFHFGSRVAFMDDGSMLISLGDGGGFREESQNVENQFGTIVRMTDNGAPLEDNPFAAQDGADPYVYSYGNRNVQGMVFDAERGRIFAHEHGPMGGDELNLIEPGVNYGWPAITYGVNYDGSVISTETEAEGMAQPMVKWVPSIAPSGMALYSGEIYPGWNGDLLIGAMGGPDGQKLVRVDLDDAGDFVGVEDLLTDAGYGFRDVEVGPDGHIYVATTDLDGQIFRLTPAE